MNGRGEKLFYLDEYIEQLHAAGQNRQPQPVKAATDSLERFMQLCRDVDRYFMEEWEREAGGSQQSADRLLLRQKNAIIGYPNEVNFFKTKISEYLKANGRSRDWFPRWYPDLETAVFQENWGIAGIYEWMNMPRSSSAKIIGERIYFLIDGRMILQEQTISRERLHQLRTALLLRTPEIRVHDGYAEVYMLNGTRITIYAEGLAKEPVIVFRKYVVDVYTFEEQARLGTIPEELIPVLKAMCAVGYNVAFLGPVRSAKTTFLATWQLHEDPSLEGVQIETDPEIPLHVIMPKAPVIQLVADGERLGGLVKPLMRSDGDYLIMAEARDAVALKMALDVTRKGTRRVKLTYHTSDPTDFCYDAATEIVGVYGGDVWATAVKMAKGYHYLFEFAQLKDKSQKRLKGIYELRYDPQTFSVSTCQICKYDFAADDWTYRYDIGADKEEIGRMEDGEAFERFRAELARLAERKPMAGVAVRELPYLQMMLAGNRR